MTDQNDQFVDVIALEPPNPWDEVRAAGEMPSTVDAVMSGLHAERARCLAVVRGAIEDGIARGVPQTSATIRILEGIAAAIGNG